MTSAQAAARLAAELRPPVVRVLAIGGEGLLAALRAHGLEPVRSADDEPDCVVQGFAPTVSWRELAEARAPWDAGCPGSSPTPTRTRPRTGARRRATAPSPAWCGPPPVPSPWWRANRPPRCCGRARPGPVPGGPSWSATGWTPMWRARGQPGSTASSYSPVPPHRTNCSPPRNTSAPLTWRRTCAGCWPPRRVEEHAGGFRCGGWRGHVCDGELVLKGRGDREDALWVACRAAWSAPEPPCTATALAVLARCALG